MDDGKAVGKRVGEGGPGSSGTTELGLKDMERGRRRRLYIGGALFLPARLAALRCTDIDGNVKGAAEEGEGAS